MKHVAVAELTRMDERQFASEITPPQLDNLSRDLAITAARLPDQRLRLLMAMQVLGNLRDFLVAEISEAAEQSIDEAIQVLMRCERELPAGWAR